MGQSALCAERRSRRERFRAEVYALNSFLRDMEIRQFEEFMAEQQERSQCDDHNDNDVESIHSSDDSQSSAAKRKAAAKATKLTSGQPGRKPSGKPSTTTRSFAV